MNPVTVYLPPEVCGALAHAERHLRLSRPGTRFFRNKERARRHAEKVQKLVSRAARMLGGKEV